MKKILFILAIIELISICAFANVERYFVDKIEVSKEDYLAVDTLLCRSREIWTNEDTITHIINLNVYARVDSLSRPGHIVVIPRSDEEIQKIKEFFEQHRKSDATVTAGELMPSFQFVEYADNSKIISNVDLHGKVILLNFWATWCGPCIQELKSEYLPVLVSEFAYDDDFEFIPVSVNHTEKELSEFFESEQGREFDWLRGTTLWDKNGEFAKTLSNWGSIPVTVVLDKDGKIVLNETGAFLNEDQKDRLREALRSALK